MAISAPARRMACAQPQAIEWSFATPMISAFLPGQDRRRAGRAVLASAMLSSSAHPTRRGCAVRSSGSRWSGRHGPGCGCAAVVMQPACAALASASSSMPSQAQASADRGADRRRVLADAGGEDQAVQPAERRRRASRCRARRDGRRPRWRSARVARGSPAIRGSRRRCRTGRACRIGGRAGPPPPRRSCPPAVSRCSTTAGSSSPQRVPIGRPSSAEKPMVRGHAPPGLQGTERGAVAEMGDDHAPLGDLWRPLRQDGGDVLVGQAVEAVAPDALPPA